MKNKRHAILDDAWLMSSDNMGGAEHTLRVGLVTNTVVQAKPVCVDNIYDMIVEKPSYNIKDLSDHLPILLNASSNEIQVAILIVLDKDSGHIQCYPFNNVNEDKRWWLYELAFDLVNNGFIEIREVHPMVVDMDPTKDMIDHLEALATLVTSFLHHLCNETIELEEEVIDRVRLNKKRVGNNKTPIVNDWKVRYVSK